MGKKLFAIMMIICMMCSSLFVMAGCSGKKANKDKDLDKDKVVDPQDVLKSVRPPEGFVLDGIWVDEKGEDTTMEITKTGDDEYDVVIFIASSESKSTEWNFSGKFDREGGLLSYENGVRTEHAFDEDGNDDATTVYKDGKGALLYLDEGLYWDDKVEEAGKGCSFKWMGNDLDD